MSFQYSGRREHQRLTRHLLFLFRELNLTSLSKRSIPTSQSFVERSFYCIVEVKRILGQQHLHPSPLNYPQQRLVLLHLPRRDSNDLPPALEVLLLPSKPRRAPFRIPSVFRRDPLEDKEDPRGDFGERNEFERRRLRVRVLREEAKEEVGVFEEGGKPVSGGRRSESASQVRDSRET